jgi:hypothetical protein
MTAWDTTVDDVDRFAAGVTYVMTRKSLSSAID